MPVKRAVPLIEFKPVPLTQCFGIQPIIIKPDGEIRCNLFNIFRKFKGRKHIKRRGIRTFTLKDAEPRFIYHYKTGEEKQEIVKNAINYYALPQACIKKMMEIGMHYEYDITLDEFIAQGPEFITNRIFIDALGCFVFNKLVSGNRVVSSCPEICNNILSTVGKVGKIESILVPESLLPRNYMIIAARGGMTFDNGILLCPLIYEKEFNKWAFEHDKEIDFSKADFKRYPIMREYRCKMDLWGEYINDWIPLEWHFETFEKNAHAFYRIIKFKDSKGS